MAFDVWQALILTGTVLFSAALVPQLIRTLQLGRADDMSASFIALVLVASACNLVYFLHLGEWIASAGFVVNLVVWGIVLRYRLVPRLGQGFMSGAGVAPTMELPDFTMQDQDGNDVTKDDLKGSPTVLYFYPKDDTPGCTKEACGIRDNWAAFKDAGIKVYGISKDDAAKHQKFIAKYELPFPLLTADEPTLEAFGVYKQKNMYGRLFMGISRETYLLDADANVIKHYPKVKPAEHAEEILADYAAQ